MTETEGTEASSNIKYPVFAHVRVAYLAIDHLQRLVDHLQHHQRKLLTLQRRKYTAETDCQRYYEVNHLVITTMLGDVVEMMTARS